MAAAMLGIASAALAGPQVRVRVQRADAQQFPVVRAFVLVTDEKGQTIPGLSANDFTVRDDDQTPDSLKVASMLSGQERIAVAMAIDRSGSMKGEPFAAAIAAARDFAARMSQQDALTAMTFSTRVDPFPELTSDRAIALNSLGARRPAGNTALNDAVSTAVSVLSASDADRKAVVVLTDGRDNASKASPEDCATQARDAGVTVYCVGLGPSVNEEALAELAHATGGGVFLIGNPGEVQPVYQSIAQELRNEYVLTYTASDTGGTSVWRTMSVQASTDGLTSADQWQYMVPRAGVVIAPGIRAEVVMMLVAGCLGAANAALAVVLVRRKRRADRLDRRV